MSSVVGGSECEIEEVCDAAVIGTLIFRAQLHKSRRQRDRPVQHRTWGIYTAQVLKNTTIIEGN